MQVVLEQMVIHVIHWLKLGFKTVNFKEHDVGPKECTLEFESKV